MLAGVCVDYYGRLERGTWQAHRSRSWRLWPVPCDSTSRNGSTCSIWPATPSPLRRDGPTGPRTAAAPRPAVISILAGMTTIPAYVRTARMEIVAANELCRALYGGALDDDRLPLNLARYLFLDPHSAASSWTGTMWPMTWSGRCGSRSAAIPATRV